MNESELWRRFMVLRGESEALAPRLQLPEGRPADTRPRRIPPLRIAAGVVVAAGLAALLLRASGRSEPALPSRGPSASPSAEVSEAWTATPSDALLAPIAFDLAHSVPDFSGTPRSASPSPRSQP